MVQGKRAKREWSLARGNGSTLPYIRLVINNVILHHLL